MTSAYHRKLPHVWFVWLAIAAATLLAGSQVCAQTNPPVTAADLPRIPPTEPADALATFQLARGFRLELAAAEPAVADPVDACFDASGRMYVAEMHGYPFSQEPTRLNPAGGGKVDAGIIRLLEDTDGDGRFDKSVVFADGISWPTSVCCYDGGVFVLAPQYLYYFKDTNGDDKADVRETVLSGFGRGNVQALANGMRWGLDNRIYFAAGRNPADLLHRGRPLFSAGGRDVRFDPRTEEFELVTGGQQFGHTFDDWGNRFVCSNSNHIQHVVYPQRYLARNPYLAVSDLIRPIATDGASAKVFRTSPPEPWRIVRQKWRAAAKGYELIVEGGAWKFVPLDPNQDPNAVPTEYPVGFFTSATGITIYRGHAYSAEFRGNAFVGDVGGNLVHRKTLVNSGVSFAASRADANEEFIRSTDNWFRPVSFVNAPDGTLLVLDMYRETIEHPYSIPEEIKAFLDLQSGSDRGRIYRIREPGKARQQPTSLQALSDEGLVAQLCSPNAWSRETAQRLLLERRDKAVGAALRRVVEEGAEPLGRIHALYTLEGLQQLNEETLLRGLADSHPRVQEHALVLAEGRLHESPRLAQRLLEMCEEPDERLRFQLAFSLGAAPVSHRVRGLARLASSSQLTPEVRTALLSSVANDVDALTNQLAGSAQFLEQSQAPSLMSELALIAGAEKTGAGAIPLLRIVLDKNLPAAIQQATLTSLGEGLARRGVTLDEVLKGQPALQAGVQSLIQHARQRTADESLPLTERVAAVGLLAFFDDQQSTQTLAQYLTPQAPAPLLRAAVAALAMRTGPDAAELLIAEWQAYGPSAREQVVDAMLSRELHTRALLAAVEDGRIKPRELSREKKSRLLSHPQRAIREKSQRLFSAEFVSDRVQVVTEYQHVLDLEAEVERGQQVFNRICANCHRVGNTGHQVAPELASVKNKSPADLLIAILDPNREAQPNFTSYTVVTHDGRVYSGIIVAETSSSITLRRAEGKEDVVLRSSIDELVSSGRSLMPEGLERDLTPQELADVIAFVKSIK